MKEISFRKIEGCGNSFVIFRRRELQQAFSDGELSALARELCGVGFGIGADGMFVVDEPNQHATRVVMLNPDGSAMGMCGNGVRCLTRYLALEGILSGTQGTIVYDVEGRSVSCDWSNEGTWVRANMGVPSFSGLDVPHRHSGEMLRFPYQLGSRCLELSAVSMGNPHCVIICENLDALDFGTLGPALEHCELFPNRANVEFVQVLSANTLQVRVWERGAGPTLACGTGACASFVIASRLGLVQGEAEVRLPGGNLAVQWEGGANPVYLAGPAREICRGSLPVAQLKNRLLRSQELRHL